MKGIRSWYFVWYYSKRTFSTGIHLQFAWIRIKNSRPHRQTQIIQQTKQKSKLASLFVNNSVEISVQVLLSVFWFSEKENKCWCNWILVIFSHFYRNFHTYNFIYGNIVWMMLAFSMSGNYLTKLMVAKSLTENANNKCYVKIVHLNRNENVLVSFPRAFHLNMTWNGHFWREIARRLEILSLYCTSVVVFQTICA